MYGQENFLAGKEETRRNPGGFQAFLMQSSRNMFCPDACCRLLVQLLSLRPQLYRSKVRFSGFQMEKRQRPSFE
ncbi:hypothetical protein D1159_01845 [Pseudoflavonifractor sp. 524-17]|nr:hypothetical protein [Pseudoflavonifractor sp. 524-17]